MRVGARGQWARGVWAVLAYLVLNLDGHALRVNPLHHGALPVLLHADPLVRLVEAGAPTHNRRHVTHNGKECERARAQMGTDAPDMLAARPRGLRLAIAHKAQALPRNWS